MKSIIYTADALKNLRTYRSDAERIQDKIRLYATSGAGNIEDMVGRSDKRLRVGDFRVIFEESEDIVMVTKIGTRGSVYK